MELNLELVLDYEGQRTYGRRNYHLQDISGSKMRRIKRGSSIEGTYRKGALEAALDPDSSNAQSPLN